MARNMVREEYKVRWRRRRRRRRWGGGGEAGGFGRRQWEGRR